ncbi:RAMP superfamily CRISPR-associated protein [Prosthecochloris sp. SCSIO W1103]|uniref:RAMP superfamily CRISPR-associated protein n=1 Tax=Prosthecochloris sp. SCSIO W1103 TaxID=2992244 RepID=UPI00223D2024|nr:RAMP superfamily CRISPR-associated protein [Prosthecochloris sp. SCSIO W1103]UZJ37864.1 RAMP superfamily CRISPR-associated protein [Prosthecochloris sp. SCSIO W1103]
MSHHPNPFDFVPFVESGPNLYPFKEFVESDKLLTGYLSMRIKALTPVHIVGKQRARRYQNGSYYKINKSDFYRRQGKALIPSSTIRGCLRSFIEAATNGWVSQCTPCYKREKETRKYGYRVTATPGAESDDPAVRLSLPKEYAMPRKSSKSIDIASFLFGYVAENEGAYKGRVVIEDAEINEDNLGLKDENGKYEIPDIQALAFMGGPHPSALSWWYQHPHQIRLSNFRDTNGILREGVDFIGSGYRGRKFYYHQSSYESYPWYKDPANWPEDNHPEIYPIPIECLKPESETDEFRIYFEELPESLLKILILSLTPGSPETEPGKPTFRHKLGYGKAYGYGSLEFTVTGGKIRSEINESIHGLLITQLQQEILTSLWDFDKLNEKGIGQYLHKENIEKLAKILWFDKNEATMFRYPAFDRNTDGFLPVFRRKDIEAKLDQDQLRNFDVFKKITISKDEGKILAQKLYATGRRKALHFEVYQENAQDYQNINYRKLIDLS